MLFDLDTDEVSAPAKPPVSKRPRQEPKSVVIPAQLWEDWASIVCCSKMAEAKTGEVVGVPSMELGGYLHCAFSAMYGGRSGIHRVDAWQLVPAALFEGETWTYVSHSDFDESVRERGDYTGLRVAVRGTEVVCAKPVSIIRSYPTVRPVALSEAIKFHDDSSRYGWRAMQFKGVTPSWKSLNGHPVAVYECDDPEHLTAVLLWKHKGHLQDYYLGVEEDWGSLPDLLENLGGSVRTEILCKPQSHQLQAALF